MNSRDLIAMGLRNLWRRKARTFLTILGVIIGTASIIVMLSLGIGMQETFMKNLEDMGSLTLIDVYPKWDRWGDEEDSGPQKKISLDDKAVEQMREIENVIGVMPFMNVYVDLIAGRYQAGVSINGIDVDEMDKFDFMTQEGRLPTKFGKNEIVFGQEVGRQFYDPKSRSRRWEPVEIDLMEANLKMILNEEYSGNGKPRGRKVNVVGILAESNGEYNWNAYMDIDQLTKIQEEVARKNKNSGNNNDRRNRNDDENKYESVKVKVDDMKNVKAVQDQIKEMGLEAWSLSDILENMKQTSAGIQAVLGGIGAVSLFVAALGITNTMIMSIYERTREIGVMKVLGAELKDIKRLFLFEAGLIGLLGGVIGIGLSLGISKLINNIGFNFMNGGYGDASSISVIPLWLIGLSLVFSILVGVISGYYPARRAMRLSALEAIRTDS